MDNPFGADAAHRQDAQSEPSAGATVRRAMTQRDEELQLALSALDKAVTAAQRELAALLDIIDPKETTRAAHGAATRIVSGDEKASAQLADAIHGVVGRIAGLQASIAGATRRARRRMSSSVPPPINPP